MSNAVAALPGTAGHIPAGPRYSRVAAWLHWAIGIALLAQIAFGFLLDTIAPRGTPERTATINLHKSIGIVLGVLIVARIAWRLGHAAPAWPASMSPLLQRAARVGHRTLYVCMVVMPLAGYIASNFSKHGVRFFGTVLASWGPDWPAAYTFFNGVHVVTAFVFTALIGGHVAMALKHAFVDRDGSFTRIVP
ncbi:MAG: cytochrome b [Caldimonas sp.]